MDVKRGSIGDGWRLFVEFDSYAIAHALLGLSSALAGKMWEAGVTRWGLFSTRGVPCFILSRSVACVLTSTSTHSSLE